METLDVGSGQTQQDYERTQREHREELEARVRLASVYFFVAAGCALICSGLGLIRFTLFVDIGFIELAYLYGENVVFQAHAVPQFAVIAVVSIGMMGTMTILGVAGRSYKRWPFIVGLVLYGVDGVVLIMTFSIWSFSLHAFFLWKWYEAQQAVAELRATASTSLK